MNAYMQITEGPSRIRHCADNNTLGRTWDHMIIISGVLSLMNDSRASGHRSIFRGRDRHAGAHLRIAHIQFMAIIQTLIFFLSHSLLLSSSSSSLLLFSYLGRFVLSLSFFIFGSTLYYYYFFLQSTFCPSA